MIHVSSRVANSLSLQKAKLEETRGGLYSPDTGRMTSFLFMFKLMRTLQIAVSVRNYAHYTLIY